MGQLFLTPPTQHQREGRMNISLFPCLIFRKEPGRHGEVRKGLDRFWLSGIPSSPAALAFIAFVSIFVAAPTHFYLLDSPAALLVPSRAALSPNSTLKGM